MQSAVVIVTGLCGSVLLLLFFLIVATASIC